MIVLIGMKTPDALDQALSEIPDEEQREHARDLCNLWFQYGECVTLAVDTEARICTVKTVQ